VTLADLQAGTAVPFAFLVSGPLSSAAGGAPSGEFFATGPNLHGFSLGFGHGAFSGSFQAGFGACQTTVCSFAGAITTTTTPPTAVPELGTLLLLAAGGLSLLAAPAAV
jgi:hypothetical protein